MKVEYISIELIEEDLSQPRYNFDDGALTDLANNISEVGVLSPIKVRTIENGRYKIIFGNRRYKACKMIGLENIPCIISDSKNELEIYLEQLAENIQRESFTPIEEAEAFDRMINNPEFRASSKFISGKLGKSEAYIRKKLDLLKFGKPVRDLIISGSEIKQNRLIEEQVLPLKDVPIEFRDPLAMIVARDQVTIQDVKRIATMFKDTKLKFDTKFDLLSQSGNQLVSAWSVYEQEKEESTKYLGKPRAIKDDVATDNVLLDTFKITPIEQKLQELISKIPSHRSIPSDTIYSYEKIRVTEKEDFLRGMDALISNLEKHLIEWRKIRDIAKTPSIKIIKR